MEGLPLEVFEFQQVDLETLKDGLKSPLAEYFDDVSVNVVRCPDLGSQPFNLPVAGFGGGSRDIVDLGGVPYLTPIVDRTRNYNLVDVATKLVGPDRYPGGWYLNGAGAGPWPILGSNSEIEPDGTVSRNASKVSFTSEGNDKDVLVKSLTEPQCSILANFLVSSPEPGEVLEIKCRKRKGDHTNFVTAIRESLQKAFPNQPIGLGGLFLLNHVNSYIHIMRDFSTKPLMNDAEVDEWLKFFEFGPPMLFQSVLVSTDPGLDLRVEHSHGWSLNPEKSEAGHYHHDLDGDNVEYVGYYTTAQKLFRVDRPSA